MKQVYPRYKRSRPLPFPLEDCSFPRSGLSDLATLGQTTVRSRKRKVLSRKRKLGFELFYLRCTCFRPYRTFIQNGILNFSWAHSLSPCGKELLPVISIHPSSTWFFFVWQKIIMSFSWQRKCCHQLDSDGQKNQPHFVMGGRWKQ